MPMSVMVGGIVAGGELRHRVVRGCAQAPAPAEGPSGKVTLAMPAGFVQKLGFSLWL